MDACAGTFSVFKACMLLSKHGVFIGCKVNPDYVADTTAQLILLYTRQVLSKKSDVDVEENVLLSTGVYVEAVKATEVQ